MQSIKPTTTGTVFSFNQFAFVDATSTFDNPKLAFELNCVLKFGTKPSCTSGSGGSGTGGSGAGRRRREAQSDDASVTVSFTVTPGDDDYSVSDGVVTSVEGSPKAADSGANEMMVSALAASAFLLL